MELKIKGIKRLEEKLIAVLKEIENDKETLQIIGKTARDYIVASTKAGKDAYKVADVEPDTAITRNELKKFNETDPTYRKNKSLTFTGQLLNSLTFKLAESAITLFFEGDHNPYKGPNGIIGRSKPNSEIAKYVQNKRPFLFLSDRLKKQLESSLVRQTRRKISIYQALLRRLGKN